MSWLRRASLLLALAVIVTGVAVLSGHFLDTEALVQLRGDLQAIKFNTGIGLILFGLPLLSIQLGYRRLAWTSLAPATLGAIGIWGMTNDQRIDAANVPLDESTLSILEMLGQLPPVVAGFFAVGGVVIATFALKGRYRYRTPLLALVGSIAVAVGFAISVGHAVKLPTVYTWGTLSLTAPLSATSLLVLGVAVLAFAWREAARSRPGSPAWLPIPVIVASTALTIILSAGLRTREVEYGRANTEIQLNAFASAISQELDRQLAAFARLGRRWGEIDDLTAALQDSDSAIQLADSPGCHSIVFLDAARTSQRVYPQRGNEGSLAIFHSRDPKRLAALDFARRYLSPAITETVDFPGVGPGFTLYAPVLYGGRVEGYVAGEYTYRRFLSAIEQKLKLGSSYRIEVEVDGVRVYPVSPDVSPAREEMIGKVFNLHDRRVRIELSPSESLLNANRRYLPEIALLSGMGITFLLGLSVHLARKASTGLRAAEQSNRRLLAENDERRRVEGMLKVSDERLRLALDSTLLGIFEWQLPTNRVYYSPGIWAIVGYDPTSTPLTFEVWTSLVHPEDLPRYRESWDLQLKGERPLIDPEYRIRVADGSWRWVYARSRSFTANGEVGLPTRIVGTIQDITARKLSEQALKESQAAARKLSLVAARTDNLVIIASPNGVIEWVNESFLRVMEYTLPEVVGRGPQFFLSGPDSDPRLVRRVRSAMERGEGISTDLINYSKSGRKFHMHLEIQPVRNEQGVLENFIAVEADITSRVATETALRRAKAEADDASRAKSEFLASMSHEIRTPMNGVIGMTSLLLETPLSPEQADYVSTIRSSGEALLTIINDILDFSKIESGKMELEQQPIDLQNCIEEALDLFAMSASSKKLELVYFLHEGVPDWIAGDITRLRQVLVNLVNNAVKFTPHGSISVEVQLAQDSIEHPSHLGRLWLQFSVHDTGIGIPEERVDRLFKPFSQVDSSTTRKYGGTGLGLAICHRLTTLMGGTISVQSERGVGSVFTFILPTERVDPPADAPALPKAENIRGRTVLCLENNATTLQRLCKLIRGQEAYPLGTVLPSEALATFSQENPPIAAVVDATLLESTEGRLVQEKLRSLRLPTVLLLPTGRSSGPFGEQPFVLSASKPLKTQSFLRALANLGKTPTLTVKAGAPTIVRETTKLSQEFPLDLLIVEDNPVNQKVALRFLERLGYRADTAGNGVEAVTALETRDYDLVFMDLQMPEMDGFEACRQIRQRLPKNRQPKIVALTANALQGDRDLCLAAGMDDYVTKPVKIHELEGIIRKHFGATENAVIPTPFPL
ncbi:MAG TPA: ATP-binding protein [Opitutaceae bacterium]|nr:ATP-binding protein [Opitutaceae bacterium]